MIETQIHADLSLLIEELPDSQKEVLRMRLFPGHEFQRDRRSNGCKHQHCLGKDALCGDQLAQDD